MHLPCVVSTKIAYGGSNLQMSMYKLHKKFSNRFFYLTVTKFIHVLLSYNISKIRYSKSCIFYHIIYTAIEALLYQSLRLVLTFKSNRSMVSFGRKHCKYGMHIYFHASFLGIAFKSFIDDKDLTAQSVCKNNWLLYVSINHYAQHVLCFYINSYLCAMHLFSI